MRGEGMLIAVIQSRMLNKPGVKRDGSMDGMKRGSVYRDEESRNR
jgi:hypothetical protein